MTHARLRQRSDLLDRALILESEIEAIFDDADHWNRLHPNEEPIDADPDGALARARAAARNVINSLIGREGRLMALPLEFEASLGVVRIATEWGGGLEEVTGLIVGPTAVVYLADERRWSVTCVRNGGAIRKYRHWADAVTVSALVRGIDTGGLEWRLGSNNEAYARLASAAVGEDLWCRGGTG